MIQNTHARLRIRRCLTSDGKQISFHFYGNTSEDSFHKATTGEEYFQVLSEAVAELARFAFGKLQQEKERTAYIKVIQQAQDDIEGVSI